MSHLEDNFSVVLPSNSNMQYYPDNKTTSFITYLPEVVNLPGRWSVALSEIHIPMTFLHIPASNNNNYLSLESRNYLTQEERQIVKLKSNDLLQDDGSSGGGGGDTVSEAEGTLQHGVYDSITDLLDCMNEMPFMKGHIKFMINCGGYVSVQRICGASCANIFHILHLAPLVKKLVGFAVEDKRVIVREQSRTYEGQTPASLSRGLPQSMYVYSDICETYITGDVHAPLMRIVPLDIDNYKYDGMKIKVFSPALYIPLLRTKFQTIEIDIRHEYGAPIPFEHGTLTVTLHFKRTE